MPIPNIIKQAARELRVKQTLAEEKLWESLRRQKWELKVYRQKPIPVIMEDSGRERYIIADFYLPQWRLIVEIDGWVHNNIEIYNLDQEKEKLLTNLWYVVLRFTNTEVLYNINIVIAKIAASLSSEKGEN